MITRCCNFLCYHHSKLEPSGCVELCDLSKCTRRKAYERTIMSITRSPLAGAAELVTYDRMENDKGECKPKSIPA